MPYTADDLHTILVNLSACSPACDWTDGKDPQTAWDECPDYHWMIFVIRELGFDSELQAIYDEVGQTLPRSSQRARMRRAREIVRSHVTSDRLMSEAASRGLLAS